MAWTVVVLWAALIFFVSGQSQMPDWAPRFELRDVVGHFLVYAVLALLLRYALAVSGVPAAAAWAIALVVLYGISDEFHQSFVPGRNADPFDLLVDVAGAGIALVLHALTVRRARLHPPR